MAFEQTRDLRSFAQDSKRTKEQKEKWSRGSRPSHGCKVDPFHPSSFLTGSESQQEKVRPERLSHRTHVTASNVVKPRASPQWPYNNPGHSRAKVDAIVELQDSSNVSRSLHELLPSPYNMRKMSVTDNILYSFDRAETPGKPLSLDIFVKANPKETEKFVEKEYEILDNNGDALKGRKARRNLRRKGAMPMEQESDIIEDDGFEIIGREG
ncbi:hypothetical protein F5Y15DRAFT_419225 [Xylariaceae sp. FL0016]|nr:hypothetical protein F5Y15DRAFT_419225 [Xylariaceae sp. FL0016]